MPARISAWAIYDVFDVAGGEQIFLGVVSDSQWEQFCAAFGLDDFADEEGLKRNNERVKARDRILPVVRELLAAMTKDEALSRLEALGLPVAPITRPQDLFDDPHLNAGGGLVDLSLPHGDQIRLPSLPLEIDGERSGVRIDLAKPGEHNAEVLGKEGKGAGNDKAAGS